MRKTNDFYLEYMSERGSDFRNEHEYFRLAQPSEMTFEQFEREFQQVMYAVKEKEKIGRLDPSIQPYEPLSPEEWALLAEDWKAFSRKRGYSETDIKEYERWLELSGQKENLPGAINDPWRRERVDHERKMYVAHIQNALAHGKVVSEDVRKSFENIKADIEVHPLQRLMGAQTDPVPMLKDESALGDDDWIG